MGESSDLVPEAEAKPSTSDLPVEVYAAAIDAYANADGDRLHAALSYVFAAGRAQAATDAAEAGLLLPGAAEKRIEYGVEHTYPGDEPIGLPATSRVAAERVVAEAGGVAWRRLVERTVWVTPWRAAESDDESRTDPDESTLLTGKSVPDPRAETEDGGAP